jgi:hypothetical protein
MPILSNANRDGQVVLRSVANETFTIASFASDDDVAANVVVNDIGIRKLLFSTDGSITIGRILPDTSRVVIFRLQFSGNFDLDSAGCTTDAPSDFANCDLYINHTSSNSSLVMKLRKHTAPHGESGELTE